MLPWRELTVTERLSRKLLHGTSAKHRASSLAAPQHLTSSRPGGQPAPRAAVRGVWTSNPASRTEQGCATSGHLKWNLSNPVWLWSSLPWVRPAALQEPCPTSVSPRPHCRCSSLLYNHTYLASPKTLQNRSYVDPPGNQWGDNLCPQP